MILQSLVVGPLQVNCFIIGDEKSKKGLIIDPGDEPDRIIDLASDLDLQINYVICTHGHFDHIGAVDDIKNAFNCHIVLHKDDLIVYQNSYRIALSWGLDANEQSMPDMLIEEGEVIMLGESKFYIIHTPGHSPGSICILGKDFVVTGDTLFAGSIGRTDFPGGDYNKIGQSFKRLMSYDKSLKVLPGHGPFSTIAEELSTNPFVDEFCK